jgi:acetoin utilization protein AcuB
MLVSKRMKKTVVTVGPEDHLATVQKKMKEGGFRRTPVVENGRLVGIVTDRDIRQHLGYLEKTKVNVAVSEKLVTVAPQTTLEEAAKLLLKHKIGGLPVVEDGQLVGIITTSDILQAFLDVMGASEEGTFRIDLLLEGDGHDLSSASQIIATKGGEILGVGTYREKWEESPVSWNLS